MEIRGIENIWKLIQNKDILQIIPTGSREICNPAPPDSSDFDVVVLIKEGLIYDYKIQSFIKSCKFKASCEETYQMLGDSNGEEFECYRSGDVNLIVMDSLEFFSKWKLATAVCKILNVQDKTKRIEAFQEILYGDY